MPKFFIESSESTDFDSGSITITGNDAKHIARVLRMKAGEQITVCDCRGFDYICEIIESNPETVPVKVLERRRSTSEPTVNVTLYQGLPKGDKMDFIVQKSVELGVTTIVPVMTLRSVSRPDQKSLDRKVERWNRIAAEAAKQSGRGILPKVLPAVTFEEAVDMMTCHDILLMLYEQNGGSLSEHFANWNSELTNIGAIVGPEGGFDAKEVEYARSRGITTAGMGPRILRTETAPLCALSVIMYATGNI